MKKWTFFVLLIAIGCLCSMHMFAAQPLPIGKNYLSLTNLAVHVDDRYTSSMVTPIIVEVDTDFTLVLSYGFIGQNEQAIDQILLYVEDSTDYSTSAYHFVNDTANERVYVEFVTPANEIRLLNIPINIQDHYGAILYQGTYQAFSGFEPYIKQTEMLSYEGVLMIDADHIKSVEEILTLISAKDPVGNPLPIQIIEDTYSPSDKQPGHYLISLRTTYNEVSKHYRLNIFIYDITAPMMSLREEVIIPLTEKVDISEIMTYIDISDNVDTLTHQDIEIIEDTYSSAQQVGNYHLKVRLSDVSQNMSELNIPILIVDRKAPTAEYPFNIFIYNTDLPLSNQEILDKFIIIDDVDGTNVTKTWTINHYQQTVVPGVYHMQLTTKDLSNNQSQHSIYIHVVDNEAPDFSQDELILSVASHESMTNEDIISWFQNHASQLGLN
ncbi:MAG: hypothetical protein EP317_01850, partial [Bacillota bacterium]